MNTATDHWLSPTDWTDLELRERMLARDEVAWREFHRRFDRLVYRCIHKVTHRFRSVVGSEDVQEIFAQFLVNVTARDMHRLRAYDANRGNKLGSWIGLLATNTAWDYLRSLARQPQTTELDDAFEIRTSAPSPFDELEKRERWAIVSDALREFSPKDRRFVQLYYVDGLSPEQVAGEMAISVKTVYSKKHKIRSRLETNIRGRLASEARL